MSERVCLTLFSRFKRDKPAFWADDLSSLVLCCFGFWHITVLTARLPDCCNRWPKVQLVITSEFFFKMPLLYFFSLYSTHDITLASLRISQFLNSHLTQLSLMYFCDLTSDPWMVILSQTRIEYSLWLTSQHTGEEAVFYYTLYMYVEHGDRDVLYLLWAISSHYSLWTLITPEAFVLALRLCMYVCMYARLCVQIGLSMSMYACMCGSMCLTVCVYVCQTHATAAPHLPQPPCWLFHWWQNAS